MSFINCFIVSLTCTQIKNTEKFNSVSYIGITAAVTMNIDKYIKILEKVESDLKNTEYSLFGTFLQAKYESKKKFEVFIEIVLKHLKIYFLEKLDDSYSILRNDYRVYVKKLNDRIFNDIPVLNFYPYDYCIREFLCVSSDGKKEYLNVVKIYRHLCKIVLKCEIVLFSFFIPHILPSDIISETQSSEAFFYEKSKLIQNSEIYQILKNVLQNKHKIRIKEESSDIKNHQNSIYDQLLTHFKIAKIRIRTKLEKMDLYDQIFCFCQHTDHVSLKKTIESFAKLITNFNQKRKQKHPNLLVMEIDMNDSDICILFNDKNRAEIYTYLLNLFLALNNTQIYLIFKLPSTRFFEKNLSILKIQRDEINYTSFLSTVKERISIYTSISNVRLFLEDYYCGTIFNLPFDGELLLQQLNNLSLYELVESK